ncbi:hypothetical protein [Pseudomonas sp. Irchel 3E13]|uniref:hypothetical protein n=1 Tax=Pseudomonas sp. Irchel 3E13 TaxID=2008975 RepID=UPI000BA43653|nr:hypothetical protein [Pseudomonas sp. Irchel 3E13]
MSETLQQDLYGRLYLGNPPLVKTRDFEDIDAATKYRPPRAFGLWPRGWLVGGRNEDTTVAAPAPARAP